MTDPQFQYASIAFASVLFVLIAGLVWVMRRVDKAIDKRHTKRWKGRE